MPVMIDLSGRRFGRLTVEARGDRVGDRRKIGWFCRCDCGQTHTVSGDNLRSGQVTSCGCRNLEVLRTAKTHGGATGGKSREYNIWKGMRKRCLNPAAAKFSRYGGRGISIDPRWADFAAFVHDMGPCPAGHTIERIDNDGNYEPGNCRWATNTEQSKNRSNTRMFTIGNVTMCLKDWARSRGLNYITLIGRLKRGMAIEEALSLVKH